MPEKVIKEEKTIVDSSKIKEHNDKFLETLGNFRWVPEIKLTWLTLCDIVFPKADWIILNYYKGHAFTDS